MSSRTALYAGACVLVVAILFLLIGLIFLLGSRGQPAFLLAAIIMIGVAIAAGVFTIRKLGNVAQTAPEAVDDRVLNLATASGGDVTVAEAAGALGVPVEDVQTSLERLVSKGLAEHKVRDGDLYYSFAGIAAVRKVKRCAYCGTEYPLREPGHKCSSCGGILEIVDAKD